MIMTRRKSWFPAHKLELGLETVLQNVKDDFPDDDWQRIVDANPRPLPNLEENLFQLTFCVETILAHLLQVIPEDDKVQMQVSSSGERIDLEFSGECPEIQDTSLNQALAAVAMGEGIIERFLKNHDGTYEKSRDGNRSVFRLSLPAVQGG